jgi:hypothetical protein
MNDPILGNVARFEVVFVSVEVEPNISLTTRSLCQLRDLVSLNSSACKAC